MNLPCDLLLLAALLALAIGAARTIRETRKTADLIEKCRTSKEAMARERDKVLDDLHQFMLAHNGKIPPNPSGFLFKSVHSQRARVAIETLTKFGMEWRGSQEDWVMVHPQGWLPEIEPEERKWFGESPDPEELAAWVQAYATTAAIAALRSEAQGIP